jgi:hypothetical protein
MARSVALSYMGILGENPIIRILENQALVSLKLPAFSDVLQVKFHPTDHNKILNFFCQYNPMFILYCE